MKTKIPKLVQVDIGGANLPYLHYHGGATHFIFVHATGFIPWLWHPVIRELPPQCSVWAPFINDYRVCDPHKKEGFSWDVIAHDLSVFCERLGIDRPVFVGHSMGATVSALAVGKYGVRARSLILVEPIFLPEAQYAMAFDIESSPLASKSIRRRNHWKDEAEAWSYLKRNAFFASWDEEVLHLYHEYGMQRQEKGDLRLLCSPRSEAAIFIGARYIDPWPFLKEIACPVMIVEGEKSELQGVVDIRKMLSLLPRGRHTVVAGAAHLVSMEKPQVITRIIREIFPELDAPLHHRT